MMAGVYALKGVLTSPQRWEKLWTFQGILGILLSLESLVLWWVQVYQPEQARLDRLNHDYGVQLSFNLQNLDLQNGFPFGHQNYVAGYIALTLPIVLGLWMVHGGWKRWLWFIGLGIQILDLYTTSSRGGWIAVILGFLVFFFPLVWFYRSRLRIPVILGMLGILGLLIFSIVKNDRLRPFFMALGTGDLENSQLTYRIITNTIGWNMGLSRPWTGLGLGNVPIVYQAFHPIWAGGEAELHYQLHSTPAQLWAELGIGGIIMTLALIFAVMWGTYRWFKSLAISLNLSPQLLNNSSPFTLEKSWIIPLSLMAALVSYGFMTLTDYQADNLGMMASLALIFVTLWQYLYPAAIPPDLESLEPLPPVSKLSSHLPWHQRLTLAGIGFCCALEIALLPMQRSWAIAHRGFNALADHHTADFVTLLTRAHNLSPWEPYYPLQLAWNLGEQSRETPGNSPQNAKEITQEIIQQREQAIQWFQTAINITPYQEFSHSNQGWLWLQQGQPKQAQIAFQNALNLLPAKEGIWFGLGLSYLVNRQNELALNSFSQELLRHPDQIISLIWQTPPLNTWIIPLYDHLDQRCSQWLNKTDLHPQLVTYFHHIRGLIRWWRGDFEGAKTDWQNVVNPNIIPVS
jgi:tetratricopeptide (TPR) repeat protein